MNEDLAPKYSFWPILLAVGIGLIPIGIVAYVWELSALGLVLVLTCIMGWAWENRNEPGEADNE
jgi:hypothetical protein